MNTCSICGGPTKPRRIGINDVTVCLACGVGRLTAPPETGDYWARTDDPDQQLHDRYWAARSEVFRGALDHLGAAHGVGRVVDLGGGVGHFTALALAMGWDAYSVDVSAPAVAAAAGRVGPERSLAAVPDELNGTCDLVTLWCVVAHLPDPRPVLTAAVRLLRRGGRLVLTTPNFLFHARYAAATARLGRPVDFAAADHVLHFTPAALDRLLAGVGAERTAYAYWGITADCLLERRLSSVLTPAKRAWNWTAWQFARAGAPPLYSELQVEAVPGRPRRDRASGALGHQLRGDFSAKVGDDG